MKSINPKTKAKPTATPRKTYKDVSTDTFAAGGGVEELLELPDVADVAFTQDPALFSL